MNLRSRRFLNVRTRRFLRGLILAGFGVFLIWVASVSVVYPLGVLLPPSAPTGRETDEERRQEEEANKWKVQLHSGGLAFADYLADMDNAVRNFHYIGPVLGMGVIALLIGYALMIWGVLTLPKPPVAPSLPSQLDRVSANLESWEKPAATDPDTITRLGSSDIQ
jgi:hypothetical protein